MTSRGPLAAALVCVSLGVACEEKAPEPEQQRFVAIEAPKVDPFTWCDRSFKGADAPRFVLPAEVTRDRQEAAAPLNASRWTWVNFWATWCGPCKAEMPMLAKWDQELDTTGPGVDLYFLSVDEDQAQLDAFWAANTELASKPTARLPTLAPLPAWLATYQLSADTPIPIHMLVAPGGQVRCIRTGSVGEGDLATVKGILSGG